MKARLLAAGLLLAAAALWAFGGRPLRQETLRLGDEYRRLRDERRQLESRTGGLLRAGTARRRALSALASSPGGALQNARRAAIQCLANAELGEVRIGVKPAKLGSAAGAAQVRIQGSGSFAEVVKLASQLTKEPAGFLLDQVTLASRGERVEVTIEAYGLGSKP